MKPDPNRTNRFLVADVRDYIKAKAEFDRETALLVAQACAAVDAMFQPKTERRVS